MSISSGRKDSASTNHWSSRAAEGFSVLTCNWIGTAASWESIVPVIPCCSKETASYVVCGRCFLPRTRSTTGAAAWTQRQRRESVLARMASSVGRCDRMQ
ncbi:hypothetical protein ACP70R_048871 [Stipagrostis hirtigluma subsp. patula]